MNVIILNSFLFFVVLLYRKNAVISKNVVHVSIPNVKTLNLSHKVIVYFFLALCVMQLSIDILIQSVLER